jgi:hypothetical protein
MLLGATGGGMASYVTRRFSVWWREALRPWWLVVSAVFAAAANLDMLATWVGLGDQFGVRALIPRLAARTWWALWLVATIIVLLESLYRVARARDAAKAELEKKRRDQVLSDLLSDKHEYGVHELLNRQPQTPETFEAWLKAESEWLKSVLAIMREHGCTTQQIRHVHTLGLIQMFPLHQEPLVAQQLSMLATRLTRIADIARQYGE